MPLETRVDGYLYTQGTAALVWEITHNLGLDAPVVDCWTNVSGEDIKILPSSVEQNGVNAVTITFTSTRSGNALVT